LHLSVAENLYLAATVQRPTAYDGWVNGGGRSLADFELELSAGRPTGTLLRSRETAPRRSSKRLLAQPKVLACSTSRRTGPRARGTSTAALRSCRSEAAAGVGIVYVSHRCPEVLGIADPDQRSPDGVCQGTFEAASMSEERLVALMIGRPLQLAFPERHEPRRERTVLLTVSGSGRPVRADRPRGGERRDRRHRGREGNGQVQFLRALAGAEQATGTATCDGTELDSSSPLGPLRAGVVLLSGDRASESLFPVLSVRANSTIQVLRRLGRMGFLSRRRERRTVDELVKRLSIRTASIEQPVQTLSGGNQQKVSSPGRSCAETSR
jgi:ribose transport system ATP-binding protein